MHLRLSQLHDSTRATPLSLRSDPQVWSQGFASDSPHGWAVRREVHGVRAQDAQRDGQFCHTERASALVRFPR